MDTFQNISVIEKLNLPIIAVTILTCQIEKNITSPYCALWLKSLMTVAIYLPPAIIEKKVHNSLIVLTIINNEDRKQRAISNGPFYI
jgi:hypothetical protein